MTLWTWAWLALALVLAVWAFFFGRWLTVRERHDHAREHALADPAPTDDPERGRPRPWVVMNPSKHDDPEAFRARVNELAAEQFGITHVHWLETTVEDPGTGQALRAVKLGASVVVAAGGDGTVRAVAAGMAHSGVRMGILPQGTGNLLARNLGLPIDDLPAALSVALGEDHRRVDLAWLRCEDVTERTDQPAEGALIAAARATGGGALPEGVDAPAEDEYAYVVIAGMGFDGKTMADTDPTLKKSVGWVAYVVSALGALGVRRMKTRLVLHAPVPAEVTRTLDWMRLSPSRVGILAGEQDEAGELQGKGSGVPGSGDATARAAGDGSAAGAGDGSGAGAGASTLGTRDGAGMSDVADDRSGDGSGAGPEAFPSAQTSVVGDEVAEFTARSVLFANCGELPFIVLAPDASLDDGALDVVAVDTQVGVLGWVDLAGKIFAQGVGMRPLNMPTSAGQIAFRQAPSASMTVDHAQIVQVDGDAIATARTLHTRVDAGALDISVPGR